MNGLAREIEMCCNKIEAAVDGGLCTYETAVTCREVKDEVNKIREILCDVLRINLYSAITCTEEELEELLDRTN